jgi:hypothetical protein
MTKKRLELRRETVAVLQSATLRVIRSGYIASDGGSCADEMCTTGSTGPSAPVTDGCGATYYCTNVACG